MKILLCPDKFKGSLSAQEVCDSLSKGLMDGSNNVHLIHHPMADGGDGSIDILKPLLNLVEVKISTVDPLGRPIEAKYYHSEDTAYIELAEASGIILLETSELNPLVTSTIGTGLMIKDAIDRGFNKIFLFIGGSATNDAGIGIANALGIDFLNENEEPLKPIGINLGKIKSIKNNSPYNFQNIEIRVLCDVTNPMFGPEGAAYIYGPQKGATPEDVFILDMGLRNYAKRLEAQHEVYISEQPGIGAAGAVGASLVGLLNARLENGFQMLASITQLESAIKNAELVITGEGKIDATSFQGKVVGNVLSLCKQYNKSCGIVCGMMEESQVIGMNLKFKKSIISLAGDLDESMKNSKQFLVKLGKEIGSEL